tara:strand:- start:5830 stop:6000 length:171 start_codon:yes stop_codon:yes gene_type:complete
MKPLFAYGKKAAKPAGYDTNVIDVSDLETDDITAELERTLAECAAVEPKEQKEKRT